MVGRPSSKLYGDAPSNVIPRGLLFVIIRPSTRLSYYLDRGNPDRGN